MSYITLHYITDKGFLQIESHVGEYFMKKKPK